MRLVQFLSENLSPCIGLVSENGRSLQLVEEFTWIYDLAVAADERQTTLELLVKTGLSGSALAYDPIINEKRVLPPLLHPDPAHCYVTGTGLTHLGSARSRDAMHHEDKRIDDPTLSDSMKMFQWGVAGGKPPEGRISVQPEWFYKGNGYNIIPPEQPLVVPPFALDGGEEAELVGLYIIGRRGKVRRVGFALGNECSDHVMEKQNYLYLAHSKLRPCSFGPELFVGRPPSDLRGEVRIFRDNRIAWEQPFLTGEDNMSYRIDGLEHHHFKYAQFQQHGDVHCHFFGTATLSFSSGFQAQSGDVFEITAPAFGRPLRNPLYIDPSPEQLVAVEPL